MPDRNEGSAELKKMNKLTIFIIRVLLGAFFALLLTRFFFPGAALATVVGVGMLLVFLAYVFAYFRGRKKDVE